MWIVWLHYNTIILYCYTLAGTRRHVTYSNVFQTSGRVGENCRFAVRDCRCAHNRTARARHRVQLQLFLSQRDWPRRHAIAELQPRHQLSLSSRYFRWVSEARTVNRRAVTSARVTARSTFAYDLNIIRSTHNINIYPLLLYVYKQYYYIRSVCCIVVGTVRTYSNGLQPVDRDWIKTDSKMQRS